MQTRKIFFLTITFGMILAGATKAYTPDYVFFAVAEKTMLGINWQPADDVFKVQAPAGAVNEAVEIHVNLNNDISDLMVAKAESAIYEISVMSDQKIFSSPMQFLLPVTLSKGLSLWARSNNEWVSIWNFTTIEDVMHAVYNISKPGSYYLLLASDQDTSIDLSGAQELAFSTALFRLQIPDVKDSGTQVVIKHLSSESVPIPDNLVSPIYQYELRNFDAAEIASKLVSVSLPYYLPSYQGRSLVFLDKRLGEWRKVPSVNNIQEQTVTGKLPFTYAVVALIEDSSVYDGVASWYAYKGCDCAAARFWPKQTQLKVTNLSNGLSRIVRVNDYGPAEWTGRLIDLDSTVFKSISQLWRGLINVRVEEI